MLAVLQFVFSGFWTWLGCAVLLGIATRGVASLAVATAALIRGHR
jgi:hypothetical protein